MLPRATAILPLSQKKTGDFIGLMGPLIENIGEAEHIGIDYILRYWQMGFMRQRALSRVWNMPLII